jgi:hypothetical protein
MAGVCAWLEKIAKFSQGAVVLVADDYMVDQLNLQQLTGANQIAGHFDVRFRGSGFSAWMVVLCGAPSYVQCQIDRVGITPVFRKEGVLWICVSHPRGPIQVSRFAH